MKRTHKFFALLLALNLLFLTACGPQEPTVTPYASGDVIALDKVTDPVLTITGKPASTVVGTVGEQEITLDEVLYWMAVSGDQMMQYYGYFFGGEIPWEQTDENGSTLAQVMKEDCLRIAGLYALLPEKLAQAGLEISQETLDSAAATMDSMRSEMGSEEEFTYNMWYYFLSPELYTKLISAQEGLQDLEEYYYGEGGAEYPADEQIFAWMDEDYYFVKHILLATVDTDTREPLDEETAAQKKKEAEDLLTQLEASSEPTALFDELMNQFSEDPGLAYSPEGYLAQPGQMVESFETASLALGDYEISGLVESEHGYHIILRIPLKDAVDAGEYREEYVSTKMQEKIDGWLEETPAQGNELYESMDLPLYYEGLTALREAIETALTPAEDASSSSGSSAADASGDTSAKG